MRVTQKEIAAKMGVSISLISRVLSGSAKEIGVPADTIAEVQKVAQELGYVPNRAAQALKGKSAKTVGVVVYDFSDPFFSDFVATLQHQLHAHGYSTVLVGFSDRQLDERDLSPLRQHILDAVIVLGSDFSGALQGGIHSSPVFRIGHAVEGEGSMSYCPDVVKAAEELRDYVKPFAVQRVLILKNALPHMEIRAVAMNNAFGAIGCDVEQQIISGKPFFEAGKSFAHELVNSGRSQLPDLIIGTIDTMALGVMKGLLQCGVKIPEEVRITGFDDIQFSEQFFPSLTTFSQPMGQVVDRILERIQNQDFRNGVEFFECPLVKRRSC